MDNSSMRVWCLLFVLVEVDDRDGYVSHAADAVVVHFRVNIRLGERKTQKTLN